MTARTLDDHPSPSVRAAWHLLRWALSLHWRATQQDIQITATPLPTGCSPQQAWRASQEDWR